MPKESKGPKVRPRSKIGQANAEMIADFERLTEFKLPSEYSAFLKRHNGGIPSPSGFVYVTPRGKPKKSGIEVFFHLGKGPYSLEKTVNDCWENKTVPKGYLPIALDVFGDFICLPLGGIDDGKIKFCPTDLGLLEVGPDGFPTESSTSLIATSFAQFLTMLQEVS